MITRGNRSVPPEDPSAADLDFTKPKIVSSSSSQLTRLDSTWLKNIGETEKAKQASLPKNTKNGKKKSKSTNSTCWNVTRGPLKDLRPICGR